MKWTPIRKRRSHVPWGYKLSEEDSRILLPIDDHLELLEKAKVMRSHHSLRELATWLSASTGSYISHEGLRKRFEMEEDNLSRLDKAKQEYILNINLKKSWDRLQEERARLGSNIETPSETKESFF